MSNFYVSFNLNPGIFRFHTNNDLIFELSKLELSTLTNSDYTIWSVDKNSSISHSNGEIVFQIVHKFEVIFDHRVPLWTFNFNMIKNQVSEYNMI